MLAGAADSTREFRMACLKKMADGLANGIERHQTRHMDTITAIQTRRSIKHFDASHQMPEAEVRQLIE
ncbi:MAG: hypothetical protein RL648_23, partial [Verrucomicrobiota bacterium]